MENMKKIIRTTVILLASVTTFQSCLDADDGDINAVCNADCTTIQGRFTTEDGKPIKDVDLKFNWGVTYGGLGLGLGGKTRKIMTGKTDGNGAYKFVFYAKDEELTDGSFAVNFKMPDDTYIVLKDYSYFQFFGVDKRDTVLVGNYHVARKGAVIKLKIKNPESITGDDQLVSSVSYKYDLNKSVRFVPGELFSKYSSEVTIETAANQVTYIQTAKRIKGQYFNSLDSTIISINQTKTYEIEF